MMTLANWGGSPGVDASSPPINATAVAHLVDRTLEQEEISCKRLSTPGGSRASSRRFSCQLPELEGEIRIRVAADGGSFALIRKSVDRVVAAESPAELHAAGRLDSWGRASDVVCARRATKIFDCDARFSESGYQAGIEVALEFGRKGRFFISRCRLTRLGPGPGAIVACQHLFWNVNFPMGEIEGLEKEAIRDAR